MNTANVKTSLTTALNNSITAGDLSASWTAADVAEVVNFVIIGPIAARDQQVAQKASDIARANAVADSVKRQVPLTSEAATVNG